MPVGMCYYKGFCCNKSGQGWCANPSIKECPFMCGTPAPDLREAVLANALLSSVYTYDGHLKGRDVVFCDHCNAEPVDKLEGTLVHDARCPIKLATDILTTPAQPGKGE